MSGLVSQKINEELIEAIKRNKGDIRKFLEDVREMLIRQRDYDISLMQGVNAIIKHEKAGGKVLTTAMPYDASANEIFAELLKASGVAFISMSVHNPSQEVFLTKDTDARIVRHIKQQVFKKLTRKTGEMSPESLEKKYEQEQIYVKRDMDKADLEIFRSNVSNKADYAVTKEPEKENRYIIMYPGCHSKIIEKAIDKAIFELSGQDGERIRDKLNDAIERKDKFLESVEERVKNGNYAYIVDGMNPTRFLSVSDLGKIMLHETKLVENQDGKKEITDDVITADEYRNLLSYIDVLQSPVLLSEKEFDFLHARPSTFYEDVENMRLKLMVYPKERKYTAADDIEKLLNPIYQKMTVYKDIPWDVIKQLKEYAENRGLSKTVITDTEIACTQEDKAEIDAFLKENLYSSYVPKDEPYLEPFIDYEAGFYHEGRGKLNITDFENTDTHYIADAENLNYTIAITKEGLRIYAGFPDKENLQVIEDNEYEIDKEGHIIRNLTYDEDLLMLLKCLKDPVIFTEEEMKAIKTEDEYMAAIYEKRPDIKKSEAGDELMAKIYSGTSNEFDALFTGGRKNLTKKQEEALEKIQEYKEVRQTVSDVNKETMHKTGENHGYTHDPNKINGKDATDAITHETEGIERS